MAPFKKIIFFFTLIGTFGSSATVIYRFPFVAASGRVIVKANVRSKGNRKGSAKFSGGAGGIAGATFVGS